MSFKQYLKRSDIKLENFRRRCKKCKQRITPYVFKKNGEWFVKCIKPLCDFIEPWENRGTCKNCKEFTPFYLVKISGIFYIKCPKCLAGQVYKIKNDTTHKKQ